MRPHLALNRPGKPRLPQNLPLNPRRKPPLLPDQSLNRRNLRLHRQPPNPRGKRPLRHPLRRLALNRPGKPRHPPSLSLSRRRKRRLLYRPTPRRKRRLPPSLSLTPSRKHRLPPSLSLSRRRKRRLPPRRWLNVRPKSRLRSDRAKKPRKPPPANQSWNVARKVRLRRSLRLRRVPRQPVAHRTRLQWKSRALWLDPSQ